MRTTICFFCSTYVFGSKHFPRVYNSLLFGRLWSCPSLLKSTVITSDLFVLPVTVDVCLGLGRTSLWLIYLRWFLKSYGLLPRGILPSSAAALDRAMGDMSGTLSLARTMFSTLSFDYML